MSVTGMLTAATWHDVTTILFLLVLLVPAAVTDYQCHKISNGLSMSGWIVGPLIGIVFSGMTGLADSLLGLAFMLGVMFPLWLIHWFGAADVKLLGSVGAVVGYNDAPITLLCVFLAGLVYSLAMMIHQRRWFVLLHEIMTGEVFKAMVSGKKSQTIEAPEGENVIPYAIPIAFGTLLSILYLKV